MAELADGWTRITYRRKCLDVETQNRQDRWIDRRADRHAFHTGESRCLDVETQNRQDRWIGRRADGHVLHASALIGHIGQTRHMDRQTDRWTDRWTCITYRREVSPFCADNILHNLKRITSIYSSITCMYVCVCICLCTCICPITLKE